jgi:pimeloyl-ACP methyl ester carboxylesterase
MKKHLPKVIGKGINILALIAPKKAAGFALKFFSTPRKGRIRPHQENFLRQFEENLIHSPVGKVATYRKKGSGKRLLLCHGWESNSSRWKKLIAYLERIPDLDILMMDAPGHGKTETPDFSALKYKTMIHSVNQSYKADLIIGHSVGAFSCAFYLHDHRPEKGHIVLMAPPDRLQLITENYFNLMGYSKVVRKAYHTLFEATFPKSIEAYNASDFVKTIEHKGIVIHDKADSINYYFEGENVTRNWANGQLISIEGSDHSLQEEEVFDYIIKEINKIESSKINS